MPGRIKIILVRVATLQECINNPFHANVAFLYPQNRNATFSGDTEIKHWSEMG